MHIIRIVVLQFFVLLVSCFATASEEAGLAKIGFYSSPDKIIEKFDNKNAGYKEHFLLALSFRKNGDMKKAIFHFANSCFKYSVKPNLKLYPFPVYEYVTGFHFKSEYYEDSVYEIARLFYEYREFAYVIKFTDLLEKPGSALYRDAMLLKSNAMAALGDYADALSCLAELAALYNDIDSRSLIYIRRASVYEKQNYLKEAIDEYLKVIQLDNNSWQSGIACNRILNISMNYKYEFNIEQEFGLASSLYFNSMEDSIIFFKDLLNKQLQTQLRSKVLEYSVKAYVKKGRIKEANGLISQNRGEAALYYMLLKIKADTLWSMKKKESAYKIYYKLYKSSVGVNIIKNSHKKIADYLISTDRDYEDILKSYINNYSDDKASGYFLWILAKDRLKKNDHNTAIKYMEESLTIFPDGPYSARNRFWLAKLYSVKGRDNDAVQKYKELVAFNPDSAYTWKKLEQLKGLYKKEILRDKYKESVLSKNSLDALFYNALLILHEKDFKERDKRIAELDFIDYIKIYRSFNDILEKRTSGSEYTDNLKNIEKYFKIGYAEGVSRETGMIPDKKDLQAEKYRVLAYYGRVYNNYFYSATSLLNLFKYYHIKENLPLLPVDVLENLYPAAFKDYVIKLCRGLDISAEIVYSVIKAESSFNHKAVSSAGARGLMQLMPATARGIAKESGLNDFNLNDPLTSLTLGVKYLSWLYKIFDGNFTYMTAGYNGGPANVNRWIKEIDNPDEDFFIEFIPYQETRHYVLQTQRFYIQYVLLNHVLYSDQ